MAEEIGAIQIGIGVNVADLKSQLKAVEAEVRSTKFPEKEVPIRVRITTPSDSAIRGVQNKIATALNKAQKMQVEITPTLIASELSAQKFIDSLTAKVAQKEIAVPVVADADPQVFRDAIMEAIGVIDVPLHWYWENGDPPSGGGSGVGPGPSAPGGPGGGANKPSGGTGGGAPGHATGSSTKPASKAASKAPAGAAAAPQSPLAAAGVESDEPDDATWWKTEASLDDYASAVAHGVPVPFTLPEFQKIIADRNQKAAAPAQAAAKAAKDAQKQATAKAKAASKTGAKAKAPAAGGVPPAKSAPVQPVASQPAAAPAPAPASALAGASPLAGATPVPLADELRPKHLPPQPDPEIASLLNKDPSKLSGAQKAKLAVHKLGQHNGGGLNDLIGLGAAFKNGGISFPKRNSVLGRMSEDERAPIIQAVQKYQAQFGLGDHEADEESEADRPTRSGINGRARRLAAPIGMSQEHVELNDFIRTLQDQVASHKRSQEYRESDPVQEFKAAVRNSGGGESGFLDVLLGQATGVTPTFGTTPQGIPTLVPSGYNEEGQPKYPNLRDAMGLLEEGSTDQARTIARFDLGRRFAQDPGYAGRLLSASRGKETDPKTGQTITPAPGDEAMVAAIQSIFGEAATIEQPRVAAVDKAYRKETHGTAAPKPTPTQRAAANDRDQSARRAETQTYLAREGLGRSAGARPAMSDEYQEGLLRDQALKQLTTRYAGFDYSEKPRSPEYKTGREQAEKVYERLLKRKGSPSGVLDVLMKHRAEGGDISGISGRARLMAGLHTALPNAKLNRKDFSDIPMDRLDRLTETMRRVGENFPNTAGSIDTLGILSNEELGKRAGMKGRGIAGITQYNPKWLLKNKASSDIHLQREMMHGEGQHLNLDQVGFTAAHEFGHALDNYSIDPQSKTQARKFSSLTGLWRPNPPTPYAETNVQENFAEIFAGQYAPGHSPRWRGDGGDGPDPKQHQTDIWKDRGIWDHEGLNTLPVDGAVNIRQVIANAAKSRRFAEGGAMRHNGILGSHGDLDVTMVGERGPELIVSGRDGRSQVVPTHQVSSFLGQMAHHAEGNVPKIQPLGGGTGNFAHRMGVAASKAGAAGLATPLQGVVKVAVVNWPANFATGRAPSQSAQSAPAQPIAGSPVAAAQVGQVLKGLGINAANAAGGGKGAKAPKATSTPLSPLEEAQLEAKTQDLVTAERLKQKEIAAKISASIREAPTRGVQTATGEVSAINLGGLRTVIERRRLADEASTRSTAALNLYSRAQEKVNKLVVQEAKETDPGKRAVITKKIQEQGQAVDFLQKRYEKLSDEAKTLGENVISGSDKLKVFAANTSGIIAGTFLFGGALSAVSAALGGVSQILSPIIERMTGFQNVSASVTDTLSDQTKASGGAVKATVALAAAQTGLATSNYDVYSNQLDLRTATEAGNKSLQQQIDLMHTFEAVTSQNGGKSFDKGLVSTTGGQFGTDLFGVPSTAEAVTKELGGLPNLSDRKTPPQSGVEKSNSPFLDAFSGLNQDLVSKPLSDDFNNALDIGAKRLDFFNNQAQKGGDKLVKLQLSTDDAAIAQSKSLAEQGGLKDLASLIGEKGLVAQGATKPEDLFKYLQAVNFSGQRPNADLLVTAAKEREIPNTIAAIDAEDQKITRPQIAAQQAVDFFSNPPLPYGAGVNQISQGVNGEQPIGNKPPKKIGGELTVDQTAISSFSQYESVATAALDAVASKAREGEQSLRNLGVPSDVINEMKSLGQAAAGIQLGIANKQAAYDAAQYNRQLYILNRNMADALALTGQNAGAMGRLGALQREAFELSKRQQALQFQSQALSLAMSQRQINFQKALAGFQAPGETAEERAARIKQAELEASYAQKQLNIQKQLFQLGKQSFRVDVRIFDASAQRQVQDLKFALADLQQSHSLQLDTKAAEQALAAVRARQQQVNAEIGIAIEKSTKKASAVINSALGIANASGEAFNKILQQTATAWGAFLNQGVKAINGLYPGQSSAGQNADRHADGALFNTTGATSMIVGEAGTETVAVLRNPRVASSATPSSSGGGGGGQIIIDVHDNTMSGAEDEERLVRQIASAVERSMNRKAALISLRGT